ncbi:MAG: hypothetical protein N4A44_00930 [Alphaproteobacteria bacterium]|jgi:hypothetical protein|nr:hypothetical protein [Alphaproteobacteria bacterium]
MKEKYIVVQKFITINNERSENLEKITGEAREELIEKVNKKVKDGYKPQGGLSITVILSMIYLSQAMFLDE